MAYVLVRVGDEGATLLTADPFATREAAVAALRGLLEGPAGDIVRSGDILLVDLGAASPVVLVDAASEDRPDIADVEPEAAETAGEVAAPTDEADELVELEVEDPPAAESEELAPAPPVAVSDSPGLDEDDVSDIEPVSDAEPPADDADEVEAEDEEPVEDVAPEEPVEDASLVAALQAAAEQLVAEGIPAPEPAGEGGETVSQPMSETTPAEPRSWPWEIEGDAGESEAESAQASPPEEIAPATEPPAVIDDDHDVTEGEPTDGDAAPGYAAGSVDMATYTCDDCVYEATCPKKGEDSPATCGSFQWRSN